MVAAIKPQDSAVVCKFGFGINSRASPDEVDPRECADGQNFILDLENHEMKNRPPFDLAATAPNGQQINGFAQLVKLDGTISTLVQAGTSVYSWNGVSTFSLVGSVTAGAKLRGKLDMNWLLAEKVIIADLGRVQPLMEWDGTTFQAVAHNLAGTFIAAYATVSGERAYYADVISNGTTTRHLLVGSKVSDYKTLSVSNKPSSALGVDDPFYLVSPDLHRINGIAEAFGRLIASTQKGNAYYLTGSSAKDYAVTELFPRSGADGDEALLWVQNDILLAQQGRIESLTAANTFGDVENNDLTRMISDKIAGYGSWMTAYNSRLKRAYFNAASTSELWVFHKSLTDQNRGVQLRSELVRQSPWSVWKTNHASAFAITAMMTMLDPVDGLEKVFFGDSSGRVYRLEGTSGGGDGGSASVKTERLSKLFSVPLDAQGYDVSGWIKYRKNQAASVVIKLEYAGVNVFDETITVTIPAASGTPYYHGGKYYGAAYYSTPFRNRLVRQPVSVAGQGNEFQIRVTCEGTTDIQINEVGLRFKAAA